MTGASFPWHFPSVLVRLLTTGDDKGGSFGKIGT